ncbi:MAG TPA: 3-hydroxyacyl-CoA dehydrogenase family protein [Acidimicrobiales bacterium]|nr:3-hydroxyacyl-CoA dehydrogenase family protein [Acidimicrobiales bacterium]
MTTSGRVAVIGAGTMGSGIAQVCAMRGYDVALVDSVASKVDGALDAARSSLRRLVAKERLSDREAADALARITPSPTIAAAVDGAEVVVESVLERLAVKHEVFGEIGAHAPADALLGTNTSQLSITRIGAVLGEDAERLVGLHFFNPPVLMRLVEIVMGLASTDATVARAEAFARALGKESVVCRKDSPGFLTSRISAIVRQECFRMVEEGVGAPADIDKALRLGLNFPMGPLELGDFNGLDTYLDALESLAVAHGDRFRPTTTLRNLVAAGRLGRKTGWGVYRYAADGSRVDDAGHAEGTSRAEGSR